MIAGASGTDQQVRPIVGTGRRREIDHRPDLVDHGHRALREAVAKIGSNGDVAIPNIGESLIPAKCRMK